MSVPAPTNPQHLLDFIARYQAEHGYSPTVREIGEGVGVGVATAQYHLDGLRRSGRLWVSDVRRREMRVLA